MEITLLGLALPEVLKQLKVILVRQGFIVKTMPTADPVLVAYKEGRWMRSPSQLVLEIKCEKNNMTRINITAIVDKKKNSHHAEEILEENFTSKLNNVFNKVIQKPYGI